MATRTRHEVALVELRPRTRTNVAVADLPSEPLDAGVGVVARVDGVEEEGAGQLYEEGLQLSVRQIATEAAARSYSEWQRR